MTDVLLFTDDGDVRLVEVDPDRADVLNTLAENTIGPLGTLDLDMIGIRLMFREIPHDDARMNLPVSLLAYGAGRPMFHALRGPVLVFGATHDGELTDVPDDLLSMFDADLT